MKRIKRLIITIFMTLLFMNLSIFISSAYEEVETIPLITKGRIIYVGGSGPGNFIKIQDAIDNASDGDTVFVLSGVYYEYHILVNKTINLFGEDKHTTIIDGNNMGDILYINADNVYISGFTFQSGEVKHTEAIHQYYCNKSTITNNIIHDIDGFEGSIWLFRACNNTITNNTFSSIFGTCLSFTFSSNNIVSGNNFSNNGAGICAWFTTDTIFKENNISNTHIGIILWNGDFDSKDWNGYNTVTMNNIINNSDYGIIIDLSYSNTISMNNIINNKLGIWIDWSNSNIIEKNNFIGNKRHAKFETAFKTKWNENYWGKPRLFPKLLLGIIYEFPIPFPVPIDFPIEGIPIPGLQSDMHPAKKPYKIPSNI